MPTGANIPPPAPWITRKNTSSGRLWAKPHNAEPRVNTTMAVIRTLLPPNRSPNHPDAGMKTAKLTR